MNLLEKVVGRISLAINYIGALAALGMVLLVTYDVIMRRVFTRPTLFADDYSAYMLVAMTYLGLSYALKEKAHIRIDIVTARLRTGVQNKLDVITSVIGLGFIIFLLKAAIKVVWNSYALKTTSFGGILTPLYIPQAFIVIGLAAFTLQLIVHILKKAGLIKGDSGTQAEQLQVD